jgi:hypothetical protein
MKSDPNVVAAGLRRLIASHASTTIGVAFRLPLWPI